MTITPSQCRTVNVSDKFYIKPRQSRDFFLLQGYTRELIKLVFSFFPSNAIDKHKLIGSTFNIYFKSYANIYANIILLQEEFVNGR